MVRGDFQFTDCLPHLLLDHVLRHDAVAVGAIIVIVATIIISFGQRGGGFFGRASLLELLSEVLSFFWCESLAGVGASLAFHGAATFANGIGKGVVESLVTPPCVCQVLEVCVRCAATEKKDLDQCLN